MWSGAFLSRCCVFSCRLMLKMCFCLSSLWCTLCDGHETITQSVNRTFPAQFKLIKRLHSVRAKWPFLVKICSSSTIVSASRMNLRSGAFRSVQERRDQRWLLFMDWIIFWIHGKLRKLKMMNKFYRGPSLLEKLNVCLRWKK